MSDYPQLWHLLKNIILLDLILILSESRKYKKGLDKTQEIESKVLLNVLVNQETIKGLFVSTEIEDLRNSNYYIVTVPTPIDKNHKPDLTPLFKASEAIGHVLKKGDTVIL